VSTDDQPTPDPVERNQDNDNAAQTAAPDPVAEAEKPTNTAPTSGAADATQAHETALTDAVAKHEPSEDPAATVPLPTNAPAPPPVPEKDVAAAKPASDPEATATSGSLLQTAPAEVSKAAEASEAGEELLTRTEVDAAATAKVDGLQQDGAVEDPTPQPSANGDDHAITEESTTAQGQGDDVKKDGPVRPTLRLDHVREISTASTMSAGTPDTPADESSAVDQDEDPGVPKSSAGPVGKNAKKNRKRNNKKKGEKNSPHPPSGATVNNVPAQDPKPVSPPAVLVPKGEPERVEKADNSGDDSAVIVEKPGAAKGEARGDSSGEDSAVIVERPQAAAEAGKATDAASAAGNLSEEWEFE